MTAVNTMMNALKMVRYWEEDRSGFHVWVGDA